MTNFQDEILAFLSKIYKNDPYTKALLQPLNGQIQNIDDVIKIIKNNFFFNSLTEDGCKWYEKLLGLIVGSNQTIEDRRSSIQAKWLSNTHNDIVLIQKACDAWKNGEVEADFINGKLQITFIGEYGIPDDLDGLLRAVDVIKPAHIAYYLIFKYLLIKDIHEVKTIEEMENITLNSFAFGSEEV